VIELLQVPSALGYVGLAALVGGESAGLPIPGETALVAAAVLASQGRLSLAPVVAVAAASAIAGDNVGYLIGRLGGRRLLARPGRALATRRRLLRRGEAFFERHGPPAVLIGRWLPWLRMSVAWLAGAAGMRWPRFLVWNAVGGAAWAASVGVAAYLLGRAASVVLGGAGLVMLALLASVLVSVLLRRH
jgi:undecaprenyl-diphosphatase